MYTRVGVALRSVAACSAIAVAGLALSQMPGATRGSTQDLAGLKAALAKRQKAKGCEPMAPIQTTLSAPNAASVGSAIPLSFSAMATEFDAPADFRIDLPDGVRLVSGRRTDHGTMAVNRVNKWDFAIVVDKDGDYQVGVQVIAGSPEYQFGQRQTLYIQSRNGALQLATEKPKVGPVLQQEPYPARRRDFPILPISVSRGASPPVEAFNDKFDPYGAELDNQPALNFGDANATVTGHWGYRHTNGNVVDGYGSWVEAWDDDTVGADDFLGRTTADASGNFSITFDNADDLGFGTADVYIVFRSENTRVQVHNSGATTGYSTATTVLFPNIGAGTFNAGGWYADWGTNGVSDNNERAYQICDNMTTAWQHWNYYAGINFDNRMTYCQWYIGSTDGSYYLTADNRMFIEDSDVSSVDVIMHEYGHSLHDGLFSDTQWPPGTGGPHSFTGHYTTGLAWTEGFATYYSCTCQGNDWIYNSYDPGNLITFDCDANWDGFGAANGNSDGLSVGAGNMGYDTESAVLAFQLDIDDSRNSTTDPYDWMTMGDAEIFDVMRNYTTGGHRPYSVQEFFDGWHSIIGTVKPKINGQMQVHGMEQPINFPELGIYSGVDRYTGTWYYGGYGRGSYYVKNYSSRNYNLNQLYVWLRGPAGQDVGQLGGDGDNTPIPSGATREIWKTTDQVGYNPSSPNFVYGTYTITAGHYRSDSNWQLLDPAETGTSQQISVNVVRDTTPPTSCTAIDDGANQISLTTVHVSGSAVEPNSSIKSYWTRVGTTAGGGNIQDWIEHPANNQNSFDYNLTGMSIPAGTIVYVTVVARNIEGYDTFAYTDGIRCGDTTPPGPVTVTDDGLLAPRNDQLHFVATTTEPDGGIYAWWTRVGTTSGAGDVQDWVQNLNNSLSFNHTITGLTMPTGKNYYITAVARNYGLMDTFGYSNGILSPLYVATMSVTAGSLLGGTVSALHFSDNTKVFLINDEFNSTGTLQMNAVSPVTTGSRIYLACETSATRTDISQFTDLYNYSSATWVNIDTRNTTLTDTAYTASTATVTPHIQSLTRNMSGRIRWIPQNDIDAADGWSETVDRFNFYIAP